MNAERIKSPIKTAKMISKKITCVLDWLNRYIFVFLLLAGFVLLNKGCDSDISGDFKLYEVNKETGETEWLPIRVKKLAPKRPPLNILDLAVDTDLNRTINYRRHVIDVFGINAYVGGGFRQRVDGHTEYLIGVSFTF